MVYIWVFKSISSIVYNYNLNGANYFSTSLKPHMQEAAVTTLLLAYACIKDSGFVEMLSPYGVLKKLIFALVNKVAKIANNNTTSLKPHILKCMYILLLNYKCSI